MRVRHWRVAAACGLLLSVALPVSAAETEAALARARASEERLKRDVTYLASDECEGRGPGTRGLGLAGNYIVGQFKKAGLKPGSADGTYWQYFTLLRPGTTTPYQGATLEAPPRLTLTGPRGQTIELKPYQQFNPMGFGKSGQAKGPVVFAGYGLTSSSKPYDDYADLDVKGKVVVILNDVPGTGFFNMNPFGGSWLEQILSVKAANAEKHGAAALLFVHTRETARDGDDLFDLGFTALSRRTLNLPVFQIKRSVLETMLASSDLPGLNELEAGINRDLKPNSGELKGWTVSLDAQIKRDKVETRNVIAVLEGSGPLANETVVIGAHYDHLGQGGAGGSLARGSKKMAIHHGADDNGSGSTAVMELARRFAAIPKREGRRLVFMTFSGEELGLLGSVYYCKDPAYPLQSTVAMVNLDMVGRGQIDKATGKVKVQVHGLDTGKEFEKLFEEVNKQHPDVLAQKVLTPRNQFFAASDHYSFFQKGVPVIFFFTGDHADYHRPSDTADKINVEGMRRIVDLNEALIARLATDKARPTFFRPATGGGSRGGVRLGISMALDDKEGVLIETVTAGDPADKAGLKDGDRIVEAGGKALKNQQGLVALLRGLRPGDSLDLVYERGGKKQNAKVDFPYVARLGLRPSYEEGQDGVLVMEVSDGPAKKGGILKGDRIVELGGKAVKDLEAYMTLMTGRKRGDTLEVTVLRDGKEQKIKVVLE